MKIIGTILLILVLLSFLSFFVEIFYCNTLVTTPKRDGSNMPKNNLVCKLNTSPLFIVGIVLRGVSELLEEI